MSHKISDPFAASRLLLLGEHGCPPILCWLPDPPPLVMGGQGRSDLEIGDHGNRLAIGAILATLGLALAIGVLLITNRRAPECIGTETVQR